MGCTTRQAGPSKEPSFVEGVPISYQLVHEDNSVNQIFIEFQDGRVVKFRHRYYQPVSFTKGALCRIYYDGMSFVRCEVVKEGKQ